MFSLLMFTVNMYKSAVGYERGGSDFFTAQ